jgi:thioesterase domain-containing protein/acyl carrier protein
VRNETLWLADLVAEVLDLTEPAPADVPFFELGATSAAIVQLQVRISARLGYELPLRALFTHSSMAELVEYISTLQLTRNNKDGSLVSMSSADGPTVLVAHGFDGQVTDFTGLVLALRDSSINFIGLEAPGFTNGGVHIERVEEIIKLYMQELELRRIKVDAVIGYSYGAIIAFEMARSLRAIFPLQPRLLLVEPALPTVTAPSLGEDPSNYWIWRYGEPAGVSIDDLRRYASEAEVVDHIISRLRSRGELPSRYEWASPARARHLMLARRACLMAWWHFCPAPSKLDATLFMTHPDATDAFMGASEAAWRQNLQGEVRTISIEGDHISCMMTPTVGKLARLIHAMVLK